MLVPYPGFSCTQISTTTEDVNKVYFQLGDFQPSTEFDENERFVAGSDGPPQDAVITRFGEYMTPRPRSARPQYYSVPSAFG